MSDTPDYPVTLDPSDHWDADPDVFDSGPRADQEMLLVHGPVQPPIDGDDAMHLVTLANSPEFAAERWCATAKDIGRYAAGQITVERADPDDLQNGVAHG